jgi:hypothetical protein
MDSPRVSANVTRARTPCRCWQTMRAAALLQPIQHDLHNIYMSVMFIACGIGYWSVVRLLAAAIQGRAATTPCFCSLIVVREWI